MMCIMRTKQPSGDDPAQPAKPPRTIPHDFGFRPGIDLDKLSQLADKLEAEGYAQAQLTTKID